MLQNIVTLRLHSPVTEQLSLKRLQLYLVFTYIFCIGFWIRLSNMDKGRLNRQICIEADNLASNKGYMNWMPIPTKF